MDEMKNLVFIHNGDDKIEGARNLFEADSDFITRSYSDPQRALTILRQLPIDVVIIHGDDIYDILWVIGQIKDVSPEIKIGLIAESLVSDFTGIDFIFPRPNSARELFETIKTFIKQGRN